MSIDAFSLLLLGAMALLALGLIVAWALVLFSWLGELWDVLLTWLHSPRFPAAPPTPTPTPSPPPAPRRLRVPPAAAAGVPVAAMPVAVVPPRPAGPAQPASNQNPVPANDFDTLTASIADEMREREQACLDDLRAEGERLCAEAKAELVEVYGDFRDLMRDCRDDIALARWEDDHDYQDALSTLRRCALTLLHDAIPLFEELEDHDMVQGLHHDIAEALAVYAKHVTND